MMYSLASDRAGLERMIRPWMGTATYYKMFHLKDFSLGQDQLNATLMNGFFKNKNRA